MVGRCTIVAGHVRRFKQHARKMHKREPNTTFASWIGYTSRAWPQPKKRSTGRLGSHRLRGQLASHHESPHATQPERFLLPGLCEESRWAQAMVKHAASWIDILTLCITLTLNDPSCPVYPVKPGRGQHCPRRPKHSSKPERIKASTTWKTGNQRRTRHMEGI